MYQLNKPLSTKRHWAIALVFGIGMAVIGFAFLHTSLQFSRGSAQASAVMQR